MGQIELTSTQTTVLTALVNEYDATEEPVKGEAIAELVDRTPGTVRNQMQNLKTLSLVEGVTGPAGGYRPTPLAYETLGRNDVDDPAKLILARNNERVDVTIENIRLTSVHHPTECRARIRLRDSVAAFEVGDAVAAGPTPKSKLLLAGSVVAVDETTNELIVDIAQLEAPVETVED